MITVWLAYNAKMCCYQVLAQFQTSKSVLPQLYFHRFCWNIVGYFQIVYFCLKKLICLCCNRRQCFYKNDMLHFEKCALFQPRHLFIIIISTLTRQDENTELKSLFVTFNNQTEWDSLVKTNQLTRHNITERIIAAIANTYWCLCSCFPQNDVTSCRRMSLKKCLLFLKGHYMRLIG